MIKNAASDKRYEKKKTNRLLLKYVNKHKHTIRTKSYIMLTDFMEHSSRKVDGQAKAMLVTGSRAHAVLYKQMFDKILADEPESFPFKCLVAFTPFTDKDSGVKYREEKINDIGDADIAETFKKPEYRILIVANKFQVGFDQPLLHTMYVDKRLGGVSAVQTLSRLNRKGPPSKQDTRILDFVNSQKEIRNAFQDYYTETLLDEGVDQQQLYNLRLELEDFAYYLRSDVDEFIDLFIRQKAGSEQLQVVFDRVLTRYELPKELQRKGEDLSEEQLEEKANILNKRIMFRQQLRIYVRQYGFVSQVISYVDVELEKLYLFAKLLLRKLPYEPETLPLEVVEMVDMEKYRQREEENGSISLEEKDGNLKQAGEGGVVPPPPEKKDRLSAIVKELNEKYHFDFEKSDRVIKAVRKVLNKTMILRQHLRIRIPEMQSSGKNFRKGWRMPCWKMPVNFLAFFLGLKMIRHLESFLWVRCLIGLLSSTVLVIRRECVRKVLGMMVIYTCLVKRLTRIVNEKLTCGANAYIL